MFKKLIANISYTLTGSKKAYVYRTLFIILFIMPVIFLAVYSFNDLYNQATDKVFSDKLALAYLSSSIVHERLQGIVNLGISLTTRPGLIDDINKGRWEDAIKPLDNTVENFPFIERLVLFDPDAVIRADMPKALNVIGQSRADKKWYKSVKTYWQPCVSEVYLRGAEPLINVVSAIIPIRINKTAGKVIGILQIQLKLEVFKDWVSEANVGKGGFIYIVDQYGHIVYHPNLDSRDRIIDFTSVPIINKLMNGNNGAEVIYNPIEKATSMTAYEPVKDYNWGVVVTQPVKYAFESRNLNILNLIITFSIIISLSLIAAFILLILIIEIKKAEVTAKYLAAVVEASNEAIFRISPVWNVKSWNKGAEQIFGYKAEEIIGRSFYTLSSEKIKNQISRIIKRFIRGEIIKRVEILCRKKNGKIINVSIAVSPIMDNNNITGGSVIAQDITELKRTEKELMESKEEYRCLVENINDWIWAIDENGLYTYSSKKVFDLLGYQPEEIIGKSPFDFMSEEEAGRILAIFTELAKNKKPIYSLENINIHKDGHLVVLESRAEPILSPDGELKGYRGVDRDITKRKQDEEKLRELSLIDELTGLNNRRGFLTFAKHHMKIASRLNHRLILIYIDMDNMKMINDIYGHKEGDRALTDTASILKKSFRSSDVIGRIGGDEFVGLALESGHYTWEKITGRLKDNLDLHNKQPVREYKLSFSFGISFYNDENPCTLEELLENGDRDMYKEKHKKERI